MDADGWVRGVDELFSALAIRPELGSPSSASVIAFLLLLQPEIEIKLGLGGISGCGLGP